MTAKFRHEGKSIDFTRGTLIVEGESVDLGFEMVGIALQDRAANEPGSLRIDGVFEIEKTTAANVIALGAPLTITVGVNTEVTAVVGPHRAAMASANGDATVWVSINLGMPEV